MFINLNDEDYLYNQIYNSIKEKINTKQLKTNDKLPSIRKLSNELNISINTVSNAYYQLEKEGYIRSSERSGFFVEKSGNILLNDSVFDDCDMIVDEKDDFKYDFSFSGVDKSCFKYKQIRKAFKDSINEDDDAILGNVDGLGLFSLRRSIANYLKNFREIIVNPNQIVVSSGSNELLILIKNLLNNPVFGFENPGYAYHGIGFYNNFISRAIAVNEDGIDIDFLKQTDADVVSVTPSHQFPTSAIMPVNNRIDLLNWAYCKDDRYIIEDDYDAEFKYKLRPIAPLKTLDVNDRVIYIGNFSRTVTPAMRVSFMVLPKNLMNKFHRMLKSERCPVSIFVQSALSKFIDSGDFEKQINQMKKVYSKKYEIIFSKISELKYVDFEKTDCGTSVVIKVDKRIDNEMLLKNLRKKSVFIESIDDYYLDKNTNTNVFLIGFAKMSYTDISDGMDIIVDVVNNLVN
ncbi:PLP-dependent aminotransferase family protein [uncultured Finegoldia sp.]|uniref:MocR-like pyridoxine biosynthesis transcription factor PdxR n=1 Tax=uncultured Finegoldia sp. TaxID=328009 RepID=UPI00263420CA|nr:PLP-dependent aminotransferase family protein [uncultured Finegoldia sp.]